MYFCLCFFIYLNIHRSLSMHVGKLCVAYIPYLSTSFTVHGLFSFFYAILIFHFPSRDGFFNIIILYLQLQFCTFGKRITKRRYNHFLEKTVVFRLLIKIFFLWMMSYMVFFIEQNDLNVFWQKVFLILEVFHQKLFFFLKKVA